MELDVMIENVKCYSIELYLIENVWRNILELGMTIEAVWYHSVGLGRNIVDFRHRSMWLNKMIEGVWNHSMRLVRC